MTPEGVVKQKVRDILDARGVWYVMPVSAGYGKHGIPDVIACVRGRFMGVEVKRRGKEPTMRQQIILHEIENSDGYAFVAKPETLAEFVELVDEIIWENS